MRHFARMGASLALVAGLALPGSAAATSCVPIEMQLRDLPTTSVVFVGTVLARDATAVHVRVDQWYAGTDPRDAFLIPTPGPGDPVIIGTWETRAHWEAWHEDPAFTETRERLEGLQAEPSEMRWYEVISEQRA